MSSIYDVPFQKQLEAVEQSSKETTEAVDAANCSSPCNTRRISESADSGLDRIKMKDMSDHVHLLSVLSPFGGARVYTSPLFFKSWNKLLQGQMEDLVGLPKRSMYTC